jgi:hypothetical protein
VPSAHLVLQLDEPDLPAVLAGAVPTPSGYGTVPAPDPVVVRQSLADVLCAAAPGGRVVHCCAADVPIALVHEAGADALALDERLLLPAHYDDLGAAVDAGMSLWCGVVDVDVSYDRGRDTVAAIWRNLGFALSEIPRRVVPTPRCGLAGLTSEQARRVLAVLRDVGESLRELAATA